MITRFVQRLIDRLFPPFDPVFRAVHGTVTLDEAEDISINDVTWPAANPGQPMMVAVDCAPNGDWVLVWWDPEQKVWVEA